MKYLIVGAVAGGASAAARLRRMDEHAHIILFEKGEFISYANCGLPYYIGNVIKDRNKLFVQTAAAFHSRFNVDVRVQTEVLSVNIQEKTITAYDFRNCATYTESFDKLILSPGAEPIKPPLPGIQQEGIFTLRNVTDTDYIKAYADARKKGSAVVVGAGFIGLEMAENLKHLGMQVSIIEMAPQVMAPIDMPMAAIVQKHLIEKGIDLRLNSGVTAFEKTLKGILVHLKNGEALHTDMVILSIGVKPDTRLAKAAGLATDKGITVNEYLQTSHPDVYAVGDAIEFKNPITGMVMPTYLAGPANKQGRIVANNIVMGNKEKYHGAINTAIVKVFDLTVATAGMASKHLKQAGIKHHVSTTHSGSHAGYYPGADTLSIQISFDTENRRLLGAQVIGKEGADKRIEMLSGIIQRGGTIDELTELEHAYAPPFSSAKDPVNIAGFVAENMLLGKMEVVYWDELSTLYPNTALIDVRTQEEFEKAHIEGALNIPVDSLRKQLHRFDAGKTYIVYCAVGQRGYLAQQILKQHGIRAYNLSGGFRTYETAASFATLSNSEMV